MGSSCIHKSAARKKKEQAEIKPALSTAKYRAKQSSPQQRVDGWSLTAGPQQGTSRCIWPSQTSGPWPESSCQAEGLSWLQEERSGMVCGWLRAWLGRGCRAQHQLLLPAQGMFPRCFGIPPAAAESAAASPMSVLTWDPGFPCPLCNWRGQVAAHPHHCPLLIPVPIPSPSLSPLQPNPCPHPIPISIPIAVTIPFQSLS